MTRSLRVSTPPSESPRKQIATILARLSLHYPASRENPQTFKLIMEDYLNDLEGFPPELVSQACARYRNTPGTQWFPSVGQIREHLNALLQLRPRGSSELSPSQKHDIAVAEVKAMKGGAEKARELLAAVADRTDPFGLAVQRAYQAVIDRESEGTA